MGTRISQYISGVAPCFIGMTLTLRDIKDTGLILL